MTQRTHLTIPLKVDGAGRFQPTGFPDLGAALFRRPVGEQGWEECLHVESPQSMANRLEATTWDEATQSQVAILDGVPYLRVVDADGEFLTSSRLEPHRLASAYIMDNLIGDTGRTGYDWLPEQLGLAPGKPMDHQRFARAVYRLDPLSLIHGVFFAQSKGGWTRQPKVARAVTAFIDARDVMPAVSGGVKTDVVDTAGGHADTGYGMVPHHRTEYTARHIEAHITIDHQQIRAYGLEKAETELLEAIIEFEVASLFSDGGLRLRTACLLDIDEDKAVRPEGAAIPSMGKAKARLKSAVDAARNTVGDIVTVHPSTSGSGKAARSKSTRTAALSEA